MIEKVKPYWEKIKEFVGKIPKKMLILAVVLVVAAAAVIAYALNNRPYAVLFTELNTEEASAIMGYLEQQGVTDYRLENNNTILVPESQESRLKAKLLMDGYPKSGFAYTAYYDHVSALSTESERNRAFLISLEEKMGAVIRCLDGVKEAYVTINPGEDRSYVLDSGNVIDATASVSVFMQDGQKLSRQQANAIRNLVAHSVKGLKFDSVFIGDGMGNTYSAGDGSEESGEASQLKLELEEEYNNKIRTNIMQVLIPLFGEGNVKVAVNCIVDVNRTTENATNVTLPEWAGDGSTNGEGIIGSKIWDHAIIRNEDTTAGGPVGTATNSDLPTYVEEEVTPDGTEKEIATSGQIDYDNPRSETHTERVAGYITDCMVSVSINSTTAGSVDIRAIREHVARAAGIEREIADEKISVLPMAFYKETALPLGDGETIPMWVIYAASAGLALFLVLLLVIVLIQRRRRKRATAEFAQDPQEMLGAEVPAAENNGADIMAMRSEKSMELRKDIRQFADENPEIAAQMVRTWLKGGEEDG